MDTTRQHILGRVVGVTSTLFLLYLLAIALLSSSGARAALPGSVPTGANQQPLVPMEGTPTPTSTGNPPTHTATNTFTVTPTATATVCGVSNLIDEGFEGGLGTFNSVVGTCVPGGCGWVPAGNPHTGSGSAFAPDLPDVSDQYLELTSSISIPAGSTSATLTFWHAYDMENTYDGGVLEVSTDGGTTWVDVLAAGGSFISGGYDDTISTAFNSPIAGRQAWTGLFTTYRQVEVNLNALIGQANLKIRFREANDDSVNHVGWNVDDVLLAVAGSCGTATNTPMLPTDTPVATDTPLATDTPGGATETPTACTISFEDVPPGSTFYPYIQCMACQGIINGYPCGGPGEPCNGNNDPYFRPGNNVTRGQFAKITANAAGFNEPSGAQQYEDVLPGSTFYDFIWRLSDRGLVNGYPCGGAGEPCGPNNLPYFRPGANATRGQASKIVSSTFFPTCQPSIK